MPEHCAPRKGGDPRSFSAAFCIERMNRPGGTAGSGRAGIPGPPGSDLTPDARHEKIVWRPTISLRL